MAATKTELLGGPLPTKPIGWIILAMALWTAVGTFFLAVYFYCRMLSGGDLKRFKQLLEGLILPFGWVAWSIAFLYDEVTTARVLIVAAGILVIVVTGIVVVKRQQSESTQA